MAQVIWLADNSSEDIYLKDLSVASVEQFMEQSGEIVFKYEVTEHDNDIVRITALTLNDHYIHFIGQRNDYNAVELG